MRSMMVYQAGYTVFGLFAFVAAVGGALACGNAGMDYAGFWGGVLGFGMGIFLGYVAGQAPYYVTGMWVRRGVRKLTTEEIRNRVCVKKYHPIIHLMVAELVYRQQCTTDILHCILGLMVSESLSCRKFGWAALVVGFPEVASRLDGYHPEAALEVCVKLVHEFVDKRSIEHWL